MTVYYVYEYYIKDTGEVFYVGKGKGRRYKMLNRRNKFFNDMYNSHDCDVRIVHENMYEDDAFAKEVELISHYRENTNYRIANVTDGGDGTSGYIMNDEAKKKISISAKALWKNENFRQNQIWHRNYGVYKSQEFRKKLSKITTGTKNGNMGNFWTEKQKQDLSKLRISNGKSKGVLNIKATEVMCIETGVKYDYIGLAIKEYKVRCEASFTAALQNKQRTAAGLHWVYITDDNLEFFNSTENRKQYLIEALLLNPSSKAMICKENGDVFTSIQQLANELNVTPAKIKWGLNKQNCFENDEYTYILLSDYHSRI